LSHSDKKISKAQHLKDSWRRDFVCFVYFTDETGEVRPVSANSAREPIRNGRHHEWQDSEFQKNHSLAVIEPAYLLLVVNQTVLLTFFR
jgi:hypothetical protein